MEETQRQNHSWARVGKNHGCRAWGMTRKSRWDVVLGDSSMSGEEMGLNPGGNREPLKVYELWSNRL